MFFKPIFSLLNIEDKVIGYELVEEIFIAELYFKIKQNIRVVVVTYSSVIHKLGAEPTGKNYQNK